KDECWLGVGGQENHYRRIKTCVVDSESGIKFAITCHSHIGSFYAFNKNDILIPEDKQINHDCQVKPCCRPSHVYLGDRSENGHDAASGMFIVPSHKDAWSIGARMAILIRHLVLERDTPVRVLAYCLNKSREAVEYAITTGYQYVDTTEFFHLLNTSRKKINPPKKWTPEEDKIIIESKKYAFNAETAAYFGVTKAAIAGRRALLKKRKKE
ncbi:MAG: hypothetical protein ACTSW1_07570, partial [Candidatus Hodarchaeales archaeon]